MSSTMYISNTFHWSKLILLCRLDCFFPIVGQFFTRLYDLIGISHLLGELKQVFLLLFSQQVILPSFISFFLFVNFTHSHESLARTLSAQRCCLRFHLTIRKTFLARLWRWCPILQRFVIIIFWVSVQGCLVITLLILLLGWAL